MKKVILIFGCVLLSLTSRSMIAFDVKNFKVIALNAGAGAVNSLMMYQGLKWGNGELRSAPLAAASVLTIVCALATFYASLGASEEDEKGNSTQAGIINATQIVGAIFVGLKTFQYLNPGVIITKDGIPVIKS